MTSLQTIHGEAVNLLHRLTTPDGILASTIEADNYKRVWARDSIICGIAGLLLDDETITNGLKNSLLTLASKQHEHGMIPSNVLPGENSDVSFGSLVGRIDANTWFIIGSCLYYLESNDTQTWETLQPAINKCRYFLKSTEFNDKGWIYTPLSGNWADEYPVHGYTLYDNLLRIWGEKLWIKISGGNLDALNELIEKTSSNFWPSTQTNAKKLYHQGAYRKAISKNAGHYAAFILPGCYDMRFDAAGNALALLLLRTDDFQKKELRSFIDELKAGLGNSLIPAFWPAITENSPDWHLLQGNYSYDFKNKPGYFHNGGIWPVWMGLFCMGLTKIGLNDASKDSVTEFERIVQDAKNWDFNEYIDAVNFGLDGKTQMGYTASGIVFMKAAIDRTSFAEKLHL
ncbi:MAG: fructofuranosidase/invertase [Bacteroidia bacterium]|nr:fructofuranosidase/invertase [Bacteroidia bacterium]NNF32206.1 fructofuranosidase/invertase [Flavobacteriaceae bacterium]MBT8276669.1 fructofuranosidase/invertase [Bacteroidia bacterium]NNJ82108.1 fructofuranosidase/invertase [Flavobacteriaceae bacterium]NNK55127.1 fructofuranosidase/invertase [Flavobacteriaceae bacterium]